MCEREQRAKAWHSVAALALMVLAMGGIVGGRSTALTTATTASGAVEGVAGSDGRIGVFRGIPYGAAPVGALRWRPPQPVAAWKGTRKAVTFGPRCMQANL
jgi:para-nitrobenzyl esterase